MHRGTPIILSGDLVIYHDITKADRMIHYRPGANEFSRTSIGRYSQPTFINGEEFNPRGIVSFPWEAIVQPNLKIDKNYDCTFVEDLKARARLINILEMLPNAWPNWVTFENPETLSHLPPRRCYLNPRDDKSAWSEDKQYKVEVSYNGNLEVAKLTTPIERIDESYIFYDPEAKVFPWEKDTVPMIESLIAKYNKFCEDKFGVTSSGIGGRKPMDFAHMTPAEKESIISEFNKVTATQGQVKNLMTLVSKLAQKRCTSSKAWRRTQGHNMRAAVLMVLAEAGSVKVSF